MLDWIAGAVQSAKTMKDISQSLLTLRDENLIRERVYDLNNNLMELQQKLLEAQLSQIELVSRIQALESERDRANQATDVKAQYTIYTFPTSAHAYVLNTEDPEKATRYFCSNCLETGSVAVTLQGSKVLGCPKCKTEIRSVPAQSRYTVRR